MRTVNVVLYACGDARRPLVSVSPADAFAATKLQHAASQEFSRAERAGVAAPELKAVRETRESNEGGVQVSAHFVAVDPVSLEPKQGERGAADLDSIFKKEQK